ncbi:MAG: membrane protein insertase YidC [Rhodocyclaceae bacterium]|nr:membrane protein insertase YidC [Rhodocyclaceae bacterium]
MDTKRLLLFFILSFSLIMLWERYQSMQAPVGPASMAEAPPTAAPATPQSAGTSNLASQAAPTTGGGLAKGRRIRVETDLFRAEIDENGGDIRHLELLRHRASGDAEGPLVLLSDAAKPYVIQSGLTGAGLPNHRTVFAAEADSYAMTEGKDTLEVSLRAVSGDVEVTRTYVFHRGQYVVDVRLDTRNGGAQAVATSAYFQMLRHGDAPADAQKFQSTYTGPVVYNDADKYHKVDFESVRKGKAEYARQGKDGWVALIQHYFLTAWLPAEGSSRENYIDALANDVYRVGVKTTVTEIAAGQTGSATMRLYAGPQEQDRLAALAPGLDLTTDYGWLTIIAKPMFKFLSFLHDLVGNWGVAIILLTVIVKGLFYPLSATSYRSMAKMRVVAPKLQQLKERYGDDKQRMQVELMKLYQTEKINPLGGCLPILVQIPVFIALYYALIASVELRHAPFYGWITDLSAPDPFYVLPILMGISMILQSRLNPPPPDPIQAKVMQIMPIAFSVFFFFFASGLVLYWLVNNVLSIAQQWRINTVMEREKAAERR